MSERRAGRTVTLRDEASVELRPIAAEDKSLLLAIFQRLSRKCRYRVGAVPTGLASTSALSGSPMPRG